MDKLRSSLRGCAGLSVRWFLGQRARSLSRGVAVVGFDHGSVVRVHLTRQSDRASERSGQRPPEKYHSRVLRLGSLVSSITNSIG